MADEDDVDILGDFHLDNLLIKTNSSSFGGSNSEILNCDYTIHPQWLLDKPSANPDNWYNNSNSQDSNKIQNEMDGDLIGHVSTENSITDESGWTEKEKNLLQTGIEIFGKSNVRLSQFIGSKTASEVKYYLKNFYSDTSQPGCSSFNNQFHNENCDVVADTQIPASIEEIIAAVCTGKPTVSSPNKNKRSIDSLTTKANKNSSNNKNVRQKSKFKFKTDIRLPMKLKSKKFRRKVTSNYKSVETAKLVNKIEITTGKGLSVPLCEGEEIVKIIKEISDEDSDLEIDVEDEDFAQPKTITKNNEYSTNNNTKVGTVKTNNPQPTHKISNIEPKKNETINKVQDFSSLQPETIELLTSKNEPECPFVIENVNSISELEKVLVPEFFEGSLIKTPSRYLKIRNHIINLWKNCTPSYVTKTFARQGLHNCGDVNCISKVHNFLEQIGAINFNCSQVAYIRPLSKLLVNNVNSVKENLQDEVKLHRRDLDLGPRSRNKKKFNNDGEGGCTLTHDESGEVINTTIINEDPVIKQRIYIKKSVTQLILCKPFPENNPQGFVVKLNLSALLLMDFHSHCSMTEVMGLIAGHWKREEKQLTIAHYEPCKNIASSETHCDMCPVSQAKAAETIHNQGFDVIGWFHSHPTFPPEPSQQDLETQLSLQQWIDHRNPCIGVILSPFIANKTYSASPFRCLVVENNESNNLVPYRLEVEVDTQDFNRDLFLNEAWKIFNIDNFDKKTKIDFRKPYFQDGSLTNLEKLSASIRPNVLKLKNGELNLSSILKGIYNICSLESAT